VTRTEYPEHASVIEATRRWLERAVIGLNLCPFAKSVHAKGQVHYVVSQAAEAQGLRQDLARELAALHEADPEVRDTTLLVAPRCLQDFHDFNEFLGEAEAALAELGLEGELQIASFHPQFQFAGTTPDDITNYTNRAPYPVLHLLREASIDRAVQAFPEAEAIFEKNMRTLEKLGHEGWKALEVGPSQEAAGDDAHMDSDKSKGQP
jgi:uncharacterized protein